MTTYYHPFDCSRPLLIKTLNVYVVCPIHTSDFYLFIFLSLHPPPDIFSRAFGASKQVQWEIETLEWSRPCQINYHLLRA